MTQADVIAGAMSEDELLANVRDFARWQGWLTYHTQRSQRSEPGFPDLMLLRRSRLVAVELKSQRGKVTPAQQEWLDGLTDVAHGTDRVEVYVWRPLDWLAGTVQRTLTDPR